MIIIIIIRNVLPSLGYFQTVVKTSWLLNPATPESHHRHMRDNSSSLCGTVPMGCPFVHSGPKPFLSLGVYRGRTLRSLLESLSGAYSHAVDLETSPSRLFPAFLLSEAPNTWRSKGMYPRLLSKPGITAPA